MSSTAVPFSGNDCVRALVYFPGMGTPPLHDWYLKEWLSTLGASNSWLETQTGWTHRIANQLINRKVRWNRDHLALAAHVLHVTPAELLMHPDDAMHIRRLRAEEPYLRAAEKHVPFKGFPKSSDGPTSDTENESERPPDIARRN